jgi:hypothetical protein
MAITSPQKPLNSTPHGCGLEISLISGDTICYERLFDVGLTYDEWKGGKTETEKLAENIAGALKKAAEEGVGFIEEGASQVVEYFSSWW